MLYFIQNWREEHHINHQCLFVCINCWYFSSNNRRIIFLLIFEIYTLFHWSRNDIIIHFFRDINHQYFQHLYRKILHLTYLLYSCSPSSGSDVVRLFAKRSAKSRAPREIAHTGSRAHKNKECVHALKSCVCVLTSLPEDGEQEYSWCS